MLSGLNTAAAGMAAQQQRMDAVANDLANANTTGYKHQRVGFRDLVYEQAGRSSAQGVRTGSGAAAVDAGRAFAQGVLQRTDRPLDVAIQGEGFLRVRLADGRDALTRDGGLHIDGNRRLVTSIGALVQPAITDPRGRRRGPDLDRPRRHRAGRQAAHRQARHPHRPLDPGPALGRRQRLRRHRRLRRPRSPRRRPPPSPRARSRPPTPTWPSPWSR